MRDEVVIEVDSNGEFQLPQAIMARHGWAPGSRLLVELTADGLLLKDAPHEGVSMQRQD